MDVNGVGPVSTVNLGRVQRRSSFSWYDEESYINIYGWIFVNTVFNLYEKRNYPSAVILMPNRWHLDVTFIANDNFDDN